MRNRIARFVVLLAVLVASGARVGRAAVRPTLTFEDRVAAQTAIEKVLWAHRIWPADNPDPKPPLDAIMASDAIRAKVQAYIAQSNALETFWERPITAAQLQAERARASGRSRGGSRAGAQGQAELILSAPPLLNP